MKDLMKALWVLLAVARDSTDHLNSEELEMQLDLCDGFLTDEEVIFFTENSTQGSSADTEIYEKVIWDRFRQYK